jgi:hypothetical protein
MRVRVAEFASDSPLEEVVSSELVSEGPKFPASWEYTGKFRYYVASATSAPKSRHPLHRAILSTKREILI